MWGIIQREKHVYGQIEEGGRECGRKALGNREAVDEVDEIIAPVVDVTMLETFQGAQR